MTRISPVWVLLIAAGCANAGITDWLNPFRMFGGKNQQNGGAGGVQQNPKGPGHRGTRQLYPASGPGPSAHGGSHGPLGSPAGHLDDGFKPSFPPGFANPPSHSPNLNPFAVASGHGPSGASSKGPLLPSQLTVQHSPGHPSGGSYRPRGRFGFGRPRNPPPHAHASASNIGGPSESPSQDGPQQDYNDYSRQPGGPNGIEFEDPQGGGPQIGGAPQRGPHGPPHGYHHRPAGRPRGRPGPPPSFAGGRPGGHHFGRPHGPHGGPHGSGAPQGPPGGPSFLQGGDDSRSPFGSNGNGPAQFSGGPPAGPGGPGGRPGGADTFFAPSPGAYNNNGPDEDSQSPFSGAPQSGNLFNQGPPEGLFGGEQGAPQGPPQGGPGGQNGPQGFFGANGNDYPEQFEGGSRETRNPQQQPMHDDFRPQPGGPPEGLNVNGGSEDQNPGFYGALHNEQHAPLGQPPQFFGHQQQSQGAPSLDASGGHSPFMNPNGAQNIFGGGGPGGPQREESPSYPPGPRGRKPPVRLGLRNPLAAAFQGSSSNVPSYGVPLMMSATGGKPTLLPVPKGRGIRPFIRKPGVILPLQSPRDPSYRPMLFSPSNMSPVSAPFEPDTAASGHGGYGDVVGLSHNGDRILYHVAGHQGPKSYRFGFDTGKGHNRIFRFEEKDGKGYVKGKYGFYDKTGKLNLINYQAHPQHGYHAERGHSHGHY